MKTPANQFREGEIWASPRAQHWLVVKINENGQAVLRNIDNLKSKQYRDVKATGRTITDAWMRIETPDHHG
jgi:hypothetical protein